MELKPRQLEILEAAGAILYEEGVGGLTTKSLAKRVGFTESALYRHYASKEGNPRCPIAIPVRQYGGAFAAYCRNDRSCPLGALASFVWKSNRISCRTSSFSGCNLFGWITDLQSGD
ncbi:MAG: TetR family transcriptional regulator [Lewinellaceae bacterium]|nr:TetR family transcriptional regulator [Lewinellaceae bacterium]